MSSSSSAFHSIGDNRAATALENRIEESLTLQINRFRNRIDFTNYITKRKLCHIGEQHLRYNPKKWKNSAFDILNNISENVTLV